MQRAILKMINGDMSEADIHSVAQIMLETEEGLLDDYAFSLAYWSQVDEKFKACGDKGGARPFCRRLHGDIEAMADLGYILRDKYSPIILSASEPVKLFGIWRGESLAGQFEMFILGRRMRGEREEIGGEIEDGLGKAVFDGWRTEQEIFFKKLYDPDSHRVAIKGDIVYQGNRDGKFWRGVYNYLLVGEIPKEGSFILADSLDDLPNIEAEI